MRITEPQWKELFRDAYQGDVRFDFPMKEVTHLAIGGPADIFVVPADPLSMRNVVVLLQERKIPYMSFGWGSNMLVRDSGISGAVISMQAFGRIEVLKEDAGHAALFVEAGVPLQKLVNFCRDRGYSGIEALTGIPGTVGGAICGNAGAFGTEIRDVLVSVAIMDSDGRLERYRAEGLGFAYRHSDIQPSDIVLSANMKLARDYKDRVSERMHQCFEDKRQRQPLSEKSAGCVFRNPAGHAAGRLIDESGCKGMRRGSIEVSPVHANFFINHGGGTASDYLGLMEEVVEIVQKKCGITLEQEIRVAGRQ